MFFFGCQAGILRVTKSRTRRRGLHGVGHGGDQRDAHEPLAGIHAVRGAGKIAARQHGDVGLGEQPSREILVVAPGQLHPEIEGRLGVRERQHGVHDLVERREFLAVKAPVLDHVRLVLPCRHRGRLHGVAHRRAVVGAVEEEAFDHLRVARGETRAQARRIGALRERPHRQQVREIAAAELRRGLHAAQRFRRLVEVDLAVALVRDDDEAVAIREREELPPFVQRHDAPARVARRAGVEQPHLRPNRLGDAFPVGLHAVGGQRVQVIRRGACEQRGAFVDLVEGIGEGDQRVLVARVDDGLRDCEQRLARAGHRQHLRLGVDLRESIAPLQPRRDRGAQFGDALGDGVTGEARHARRERVGEQLRRGVLRLADREVDVREPRGRRDAGQEQAQLLERVRVQEVEAGVHGVDYKVWAPAFAGATKIRCRARVRGREAGRSVFGKCAGTAASATTASWCGG